MEALRGLYLVIKLHDEFSAPLRRANALMEDSAKRMMLMDKLAGRNTQKWMYQSAAFEKSLAKSSAFFAQVDAVAREAYVRQKYQSRIMQDIALKYDTLRRKVAQYGSAVRDSMRGAGAALKSHAEDLRNVGLGAMAAIGGILWRVENYESAMAKIRALTADSREEYEYYLQILNEFSKTGLFSKSDIANMIAYAKANKLTREELEFLLPYVKSASIIYGEDLTLALTAMVRAMKYGEAELAERIGLQLRENAVMKESMELYGKRLSELTAEQKQRVIMLAIQRQMADIVGRENEMLGENIIKLRKAKVALDNAAITIGSYLLPPLAKAATAFANLLKWLDKKPVLGSVVAYGLLATALVGIGGYAAIKAAEALKLVSTTLLKHFIPSTIKAAYTTGGLTAALRASAVAFKGFALSVLTNPITWAILSIVGAILLLQHAWVHNWWDIQGKTRVAIDAIIGAINQLRQGFDWLAKSIGGAISWIQQAIDRMGPLKYILLGPVGSIMLLIRNIDRLRSATSSALTAIKSLWDRTIGWIITKIDEFITKIKQAWEFITKIPIGKAIETAFSFTPAGALLKAIKFVQPKIKPVIEKPEMDKRFYEEGSVVLKVKTPKIKPEVEKPDIPEIQPAEPIIKPRVEMSWLERLYMSVQNLFKTINLPVLQTNAVIKPVMANIPKLPELMGAVKYIPDVIKPAIPPLSQLISATAAQSAPNINISINTPINLDRVEIRNEEDIKKLAKEIQKKQEEIAEKVVYKVFAKEFASHGIH